MEESNEERASPFTPDAASSLMAAAVGTSTLILAPFTAEQLLRAASPVPNVLRRFRDRLGGAGWMSEEGQASFASLLQSTMDPIVVPSPNYRRRLIRLYVCEVEKSGAVVENEELLRLLFQMSVTKDAALPDPLEAYHVSLDCARPLEPLSLRVFPRHNDISLRLWEAGACLAEFFLAYPTYVQGQRVVELGAGVGLTGFVVSALCRSRSYHMTDCTEACLENLQHNLELNKVWLQEHGQLNETDSLTVGYLDWEWVAAEGSSAPADVAIYTASFQQSITALSMANVLVAADVVYDVQTLPYLARTVHRFLSGDGSKSVIFATTMRNKITFDTFEDCLTNLGIDISHKRADEVAALPRVFPVYHVQPRSDIRVCFLRNSQRVVSDERDEW